VIFRAGMLVTTRQGVEAAELFAMLPSLTLSTADGRYLKQGQVAIVIALSSYDAKAVYLIGPCGAGWAFGAFLERVV
jgi:hypothetical protein